MEPNLLKWPTAPRGRPKRLNPAFPPRPKAFLQKGLRSAGGPKLLKWGLPGRGVKSAKVPPTPYNVYYLAPPPPGRLFFPKAKHR
eukprot:scaffold131809_cov39-Phaeocystis_antarctica.AAC.1